MTVFSGIANSPEATKKYSDDVIEYVKTQMPWRRSKKVNSTTWILLFNYCLVAMLQNEYIHETRETLLVFLKIQDFTYTIEVEI